MHICLQLGSTLGPIGIHTCSENDYLCVSVQASPILQICHLAQKTQCLGSHLPRPLVLYTTMAKKAGKGVMAKKAGKGGGWKPWLNPPAGKGVTGKEWRKALTKKKDAFAKAQASHVELAIALAEADKARTAYAKAVSKTKKIAKRAAIDLKKASALE